METREMASPVGSKAGARDAVIGGERTASSANPHVSAPPAQDAHPNPTVPQANSMLLGHCQPLRGAEGDFYFRTETDTAHALHQHMRLDDKAMPARPSTIWVNPPKTKEDQAGKLYVILPEMTIPVADILCYQKSRIKFSTTVSKKIKANMISDVRLDASRFERMCRWKNERGNKNYRVRSQRRLYEKKLRNWKSEKRPYRRPTLTTVGPTGFIADRNLQYESNSDEQMAIIQFPEAIVDKGDLTWGDRGRLMVGWPIAQELLAHAILWLDIQHPILSDIDAMTTPLETNANSKNLPIDIVRYFTTQNKWIWITKMEIDVHGFWHRERYVIDFRETEFANTARMMYFQKGQTLYLHHLCHPARRDLEEVDSSVVEMYDLGLIDLFSLFYHERKVRGALDVPQHDRGVRVPGSLFEGVVHNLNLRGKLNSLVQKSKQAVRSGHDSPPHGDLFFVDIFTANEKMPNAISEVLAEGEQNIELIYDFAWSPPNWGPPAPPATILESPKSLKAERRLKANEEPEEDQWVPDSRVFNLCPREIPGIESWYQPRKKYDDEYRDRIQKVGSTSSPPTANWTCIVEAACFDCYDRFWEAIDTRRKPPLDLFAPHCSFGADEIQEWERRGELRYNRWDWSKYPNNGPAPSTQPTTGASPLAKKEAIKVNGPSGKDLPVESTVAKEGDEETLPMRTTSTLSALVTRLQHLKPGRPFGSPPLQNPVQVSSLGSVTPSGPAGVGPPAIQSPAQPSSSNPVSPSAPSGAGAAFAKVVYATKVKFKNISARHLAKVTPRNSVDGVTESTAVAGGPTPEEPVNVNPADIPLPIDEDVQTDDRNPGSEENINTVDLESAKDRPREDSGYASNFDHPGPSNTGRSPEHAVSSSLDMGNSAKRGLGNS